MQQLSLFDNDMLGSEYKTIESKDWNWTFKDYPPTNNLKVFSCFACGGGSSMGYKLAGYEVIGDLEIDKRINSIYVKNHNPKYNFNLDIREFNNIPNNELPQELFELDILDGSPPCTTFSMCGLREKTWGKKKKFKEGQKEQTLDDLSFIFIETVNKLRPKFVVIENVEGIMNGKAWKYVQNIYSNFQSIGYKVKHWLLKGKDMGVPQKRHRVFFIATRLDIDIEKLNMSFTYKPILFEQVKSPNGIKITSENLNTLISYAKKGDRNLQDACLRQRGTGSYFNYCLVYDEQVAPTLTAHCNNIRWDQKSLLSKQDIINLATFPQDYDFQTESLDSVTYICGMSVPPIMIKRIAERLKKYLIKENKNE